MAPKLLENAIKLLENAIKKGHKFHSSPLGDWGGWVNSGRALKRIVGRACLRIKMTPISRKKGIFRMKLTASYVMIYIEIEKKPISLHLRSDFIIREYDYDIESESIMTVITYIIYAFQNEITIIA